MYRSQSEFSLEEYQPLTVKQQIRWSIREKIKSGKDPLSLIDIDGRDEAKLDVIRALLSGSHPYLVSEEGTGKTRLARSLSELLPTVPAIKGCAYHDDPKWSKEYLCGRCASAKDPVGEYGIEFIPGKKRFSRIQGNEYTNAAKILGFKDVQEIIHGKSPTDPSVFTGTGVFHGNRGITFVDELPSIPTKVQVLFHPILEEGKAILEEYGWEHPIDTILIANGNPEGFSHVNKIPRPLLDRLEMIRLTYPTEETEEKIMMKQRFKGHKNNDYVEEPVPEKALVGVDYSLIERNVIVPWWLAKVINRSVRYARKCDNLEKGASIRGPIKGIDHAASSTEIRNRNVARMKDAYDGLKLALRGRIVIRPDLMESAEQASSLSDDVTEDVMRHALEKVAEEFYEDKLKGDQDLFKELKGCIEGKWDAAVGEVSDGKYKHIRKLALRMFAETPKKVDVENLSNREKQLFLDSAALGKPVLTEAYASALEFIIGAAAFKKDIDVADAEKIVFIPKRFGLHGKRSRSGED